jgi:hypothetical protein
MLYALVSSVDFLECFLLQLEWYHYALTSQQ